MPIQIGDTLGDYQVTGVLGRGGMVGSSACGSGQDRGEAVAASRLKARSRAGLRPSMRSRRLSYR